MLYILTLEAVVLLSWVVAAAGGTAARSVLGPGAAFALNVAGALSLCAYAAWLWNKERNAGPSPRASGSLVIVAFLGSLDELSYFPGLQWSGLFTAAELAAGTLLAGLAVAAVCLGAAGLKPLVRRIESIPLWGIVAAFALLSLAQALR